VLTGPVIVAASFLYLLLLFAVAYFGDKRADAGRSVIANPTIYALSLAVYCTTWTTTAVSGGRPRRASGSCRSSSGRPWRSPCGGS
jgi:Na+/proline symporter